MSEPPEPESVEPRPPVPAPLAEQWSGSEFTDLSIIDWKRARSVIEHENNLTNHRQTWLMNSQAFLFAAYALVFTAFAKTDVEDRLRLFFPMILFLISFIGFCISLFLGKSIKQAEIQHEKVHDWWTARYGAKDQLKTLRERRHPEVAGHVHPTFSPSHLAIVFVIVWIFCFVAAAGLCFVGRGARVKGGAMQPAITSGKYAAVNAKRAGTTFTDACLDDALFHDVSLERAALRDVNLSGARFEDVDLSGVVISNANVEGMTINGILVSELLAARRPAK